MIIVKSGLMTPELELCCEEIDPAENKKNTEITIKYWNLGPLEGSPKPGENKEYWVKMAEIWGVEEDQARRQMCANCEYFDNSPERMEVMDAVPFNDFDVNGGGRGYCTEFNFICHNLRTCQEWEAKECNVEED